MPKVVFCILFLLTACGFKPVHDDTKPSMTSVYVSPIDKTRNGQLLKAELEDLLNPSRLSADAKYILDISYDYNVEGLGITSNRIASRYNIVLTTSYTLTEAATGNEVLNGQETAITSYNRVDSEFAIFVSKQNAINHALRQVALQVRNSLLAII